MENPATKLLCHECGEPIPAADVNIALGIAKCTECDVVFNFGAAAQAAQIRRAEVPMPKGITVDDLGSSFAIMHRWFGIQYIFLAIWCVAWDGFLIFWYSMALTTGSWIMTLFPIIHVAVGASLSYYTLAGFLNRTVISVDASLISIRHAPLPWWGNKDLPTLQVKQLYCKEKEHRGKHGRTYSYTVLAITQDHKRHELLSGLNNSDQALFIEQHIEKRLRLDDTPVEGAHV